MAREGKYCHLNPLPAQTRSTHSVSPASESKVSITPGWMGFGHGRHAWSVLFNLTPYSFLSWRTISSMHVGPSVQGDSSLLTSELRAILAHIVMNYTLKLDGGGARPKNFFSVDMVPPPNGRVLFKKRDASD